MSKWARHVLFKRQSHLENEESTIVPSRHYLLDFWAFDFFFALIYGKIERIYKALLHSVHKLCPSSGIVVSWVPIQLNAAGIPRMRCILRRPRELTDPASPHWILFSVCPWPSSLSGIAFLVVRGIGLVWWSAILTIPDFCERWHLYANLLHVASIHSCTFLGHCPTTRP
jgi:hypothetical protein